MQLFLFLTSQKIIILATKTNTELFLCGHTHGGQIFPFHYFSKIVSTIFIWAFFIENKTTIYVNKGLGTWGIDYRYKANNEISILKLIAKSVE